MALVRKILETTLTAGTTSVTFTDADIPNSLIRTYCTNSDLYPVSLSLTGNNLTVTYDAQPNNIGVALEIVKSGLEIIDNLTSTNAEAALSAKQGKILKDTIDGLTAPALTELSDVDFVSLAEGDIIVYDAVNEKFINQTMPSIPSQINDLDDVNITSPADGQVLTYENGNFINVTIATNKNYQETEQNTGLKWIDNRDIYFKTVKYTGTYYGADSVSLDTGITNVNELLPMTTINAINNSNANIPLPYAHSNSNNNIGYFISSDFTKLNLRMGNVYTSSVYVKQILAVYYYTKTS